MSINKSFVTNRGSKQLTHYPAGTDSVVRMSVINMDSTVMSGALIIQAFIRHAPQSSLNEHGNRISVFPNQLDLLRAYHVSVYV